MELTDPREIQTALSKPFAPEDLEWRLQQTFEDKMRGIPLHLQSPLFHRGTGGRWEETAGAASARHLP